MSSQIDDYGTRVPSRLIFFVKLVSMIRRKKQEVLEQWQLRTVGLVVLGNIIEVLRKAMPDTLKF